MLPTDRFGAIMLVFEAAGGRYSHEGGEDKIGINSKSSFPVVKNFFNCQITRTLHRS